jgi:hypothetical protein
LPCSLRSHRTANPTPKNGLRHFSALPTHHPAGGRQRKKQEQFKIIEQNYFSFPKITTFTVLKRKKNPKINCNFAKI